MKIILKGARIIDAQNDFIGNVSFEDGYISSVTSETFDAADAEVIDLSGFAVLPGFIDMHVHFRTPGYPEKETFETGLRAALKGGYTTVCGMANTNPVCDDARIIKQNMTDANALGLANYIQIGALGKNLEEQEPVDYNSVLAYTNMLSNDGNTVFDDQFMTEALIESQNRGFLICTHSEPETPIVKRDIRLLREFRGNLHICHISRKETIDAIVRAKDEGLHLTCEITPHHLFSYGLDYRVNPPFAGKSDVEALMKGITDGYIDILATDHAPHTLKDKQNGSPGISNIETAFSMYWKVFSDNGISLKKFSHMASYAPAQRLGLAKGLLKIGYPADLAVIDPEYEGQINLNKFVSKSNNSPFDGCKIKGKVVMSIVGGEIKYDNR